MMGAKFGTKISFLLLVVCIRGLCSCWVGNWNGVCDRGLFTCVARC